MKTYRTRYERLVSNIAEPENEQACWIWTGQLRNGYPAMSERRPGGGRATPPRTVAAHRAMLEEILDATFPFDEAGHLCYNTRCINPDHLEVQTPSANLADRRGYISRDRDACPIPTLYPRPDALDAATTRPDPERGSYSLLCPF